jgi:hypothetical protein
VEPSREKKLATALEKYLFKIEQTQREAKGRRRATQRREIRD